MATDINKLYQTRYVGANIEGLRDSREQVVSLARRENRYRQIMTKALIQLKESLSQQPLAKEYSLPRNIDQSIKDVLHQYIQAGLGIDPPLPQHELDGAGRPYELISEDAQKQMSELLREEMKTGIDQMLQEIRTLPSARSYRTEQRQIRKDRQHQQRQMQEVAARIEQRKKEEEARLAAAKKDFLEKMNQTYGLLESDLQGSLSYESMQEYQNKLEEYERDCRSISERYSRMHTRFLSLSVLLSVTYAISKLKEESSHVEWKGIANNIDFIKEMIKFLPYYYLQDLIDIANEPNRSELKKDEKLFRDLVFIRGYFIKDILHCASKEVRDKLRKDLDFITCIVRRFLLHFTTIFKYSSDDVKRELEKNIPLLKEVISSNLLGSKAILQIVNKESCITLGQDKTLLTNMCKMLLKESDLREILALTGNLPMKDKEWIMEFIKKYPQFTRAIHGCIDPDMLKDPDIQSLFPFSS